MRKLFVVTVTLSIANTCVSQPDTVLATKQKGFLFLSAYNYQYDWDGYHMRPLGFHDFFYLSDFQNTLNSNDTIVFTGGIRIKFIAARFGLKKDAIKVYGKDTSKCYNYDSFYVVPVIVDLKLFEDYEPFVCQRNFYAFRTVTGKELRFEYLHKAASITRLTEMPDKRKKIIRTKNSR